MKFQHTNISQSGFAAIELLFTFIIIGLILGGGIYLSQRKQDTPSSTPSYQY